MGWTWSSRAGVTWRTWVMLRPSWAVSLDTGGKSRWQDCDKTVAVLFTRISRMIRPGNPLVDPGSILGGSEGGVGQHGKSERKRDACEGAGWGGCPAPGHMVSGAAVRRESDHLMVPGCGCLWLGLAVWKWSPSGQRVNSWASLGSQNFGSLFHFAWHSGFATKPGRCLSAVRIHTPCVTLPVSKRISAAGWDRTPRFLSPWFPLLLPPKPAGWGRAAAYKSQVGWWVATAAPRAEGLQEREAEREEGCSSVRTLGGAGRGPVLAVSAGDWWPAASLEGARSALRSDNYLLWSNASYDTRVVTAAVNLSIVGNPLGSHRVYLGRAQCIFFLLFLILLFLIKSLQYGDRKKEAFVFIVSAWKWKGQKKVKGFGTAVSPDIISKCPMVLHVPSPVSPHAPGPLAISSAVPSRGPSIWQSSAASGQGLQTLSVGASAVLTHWFSLWQEWDTLTEGSREPCSWNQHSGRRLTPEQPLGGRVWLCLYLTCFLTRSRERGKVSYFMSKEEWNPQGPLQNDFHFGNFHSWSHFFWAQPRDSPTASENRPSCLLSSTSGCVWDSPLSQKGEQKEPGWA